ncbi:AIM24 family protein [Novosphingobium sp. Chol11]|uniref:AIM24 family protein n=1 Tax=Novosphingobium sp. Chol11 TaxID=1385763 RepID=UPI0025E15934|nr:AIM24 family protein [Novosphingobium sp. Chol11]
MADYRTKIDEKTGTGARFELYQFARKSYALGMAGEPGGIHVQPARTMRQLRIVLAGGAALLEPGALQYAIGKLQVEVQKNDQGGIFARAVRSAGTGESAFATRYAGHGEVWTEPTDKQFIIAEMDGPGDALILDDKAFYACEATIAIKTHVHKTISGALSGGGLMQPKLEGAGVFVVESPVPVDEIEAIELDDSGELIVDGDLMLMYSATLQVELRPLVRGMRNALRSGEGLVFVLRGRGTVWLTPTMRL